MALSARARLGLSATLLAALLTAPVAWAGPEGAALPVPEARAWLLRMHQAARAKSYQGTLVVSASGLVSSSRVSHFGADNHSYERVEMQDGQPRVVLRHDDEVVTLWPQAKRARVEQRDAVALFPSVLTGSDEGLLERYDMVAEGPSRVAGHDASVFLLRPRDAARFAQRLWAEATSALLLRADVLGADGRVIETAAFTDVAIGIRAQPETVLGAMRKLDGYKVVRAAPQRTTLDAEGWRLAPPVAGFRQVSCVRRSFERAGEALNAGEPVEVLQAIFSDGLTHVSVFIEPMRAEGRRAGHAAFGATHTLMLPHGGGHWLTVMGDVPLATLKKFAQALESRR
ncbi:MAG TPA: MucB/RseB C-terminal domain-containing protein [Burkholderiaceae bacterium]|nr:MucB/RseB C-terminal domain-containing protein [Burkholderiaceae bacterium]